MTDSSILARFGMRAGFTLVKVADIGLPIFRFHSVCLVVETTPASVVEEYVLRALTLKINQPSQLRDLLGLPQRVLLSRLADMLREGLISEMFGADGQMGLTVTAAGRSLLAERTRIRPQELPIPFLVDGLTHKIYYVPESELLRPKQVKAAGIPEISPMPAKGPEPADLDVAQITNYIRDIKPPNIVGERQVLRIIRVDKRERLFLPSIAMVFRATSGEEYQVAFVIDGRLSQDHEVAFRRKGGIDRSNLFGALRSGKEVIDFEKTVGPELATMLAGASNEYGAKRALLSLKKNNFSEKSRTDHIRGAVRQLSVVEHNPLMMQAIREVRESLIIVSPWVRREIVNESFLNELATTLKRGVLVTIGYGIKRGKYDEDMDALVKRDFEELKKKFDNFSVKRLGDTHAKILVKDRDYFVVTSFNWLSFRGDPERQFREEWGTIIESRGLTEDFLRQQLYPRLGIVE